MLCLKCINELPRTGFAPFNNNPVEKYFRGRIHFEVAHSEFYFSKGSLIQQLIHELKYKDNTGIGVYLAELMALSILKSDRFKNIDALVPLPLYADRERMRGYNQASVICEGLSPILNVPTIIGNVTRERFTETQTRKHRTERWTNVFESFAVQNYRELHEKHILLVDDVVTTGATLEACGTAIIGSGARLSFATLALASR
jgi:ComF family protein